MKYYFYIAFSFLFFCCLSLNAKELPKGIPNSITGELFLATVAENRELRRNYAELNIEELDEINGLFIIDKKNISNEEQTKRVIKELQKNTSVVGPSALCFNPRHYLSYTSKYGEVNLEICFECSRVNVTLDGWHKSLYINKESAKELNEFYSKINLTIPNVYK